MIGYLGLARETFDVSFAESKFKQGKKALLSASSKTSGINYLVTNDQLSKNAFEFLLDHVMNFKINLMEEK